MSAAAAFRHNSSSSDNMTQFKKRGNSLVFRNDLLRFARSMTRSLCSFQTTSLEKPGLRHTELNGIFVASMLSTGVCAVRDVVDLGEHLLAIF